MLTHQVRTYSVHRETPKMALYILNRGRNAGKPLHEPCPNCFILYVRDSEELETYYWIFYAFWKHGFFHPHLCGSVIEMLRLGDLKTLMRNSSSLPLKSRAIRPKWWRKSKPPGNWSRRSASRQKHWKNFAIPWYADFTYLFKIQKIPEGIFLARKLILFY